MAHDRIVYCRGGGSGRSAGTLGGIGRLYVLFASAGGDAGGGLLLWKLIWPAWLSPFYPLDGRISVRSEEFLMPLLFCVVVTVVVVWQRARAPVLAAAWWSYLAVLGPVLGLLQVGGQAVADRYMYLAMVPALIALGSVLIMVMASRARCCSRPCYMWCWGCGLFFSGCRRARRSVCGGMTCRCGARC